MAAPPAVTMPRLLISLGTSWAVVPEAFHLLPPGRDGFRAVHFLTTASEQIDSGIAELLRYFQRFPEVTLTVTRVDGFTELRSEENHFAFEEVLYRWMLECRQHAGTERGQDQADGTRTSTDESMTGGTPGSTCKLRSGGTPASTFTLLPHVCLAGGFKTMSAAMQKAAAVLGAADVFHVLGDPIFDDEREPGRKREARTGDEVDHALAVGAVRFVRLGPESGWPQLRAATSAEYPLETIVADGAVRTVRAPDTRLRSRLREIVERSHRIAGAWDRLAHLPFAELATWSEADLRWLGEPLDPSLPTDRAWVAALPKIELHCHLGGFATHGSDLAAIRAAAENPVALPRIFDCPPPPGWPCPAEPIGLDAYMHLGDNNGRRLLKDPGCLRRQCELLYERLVADGVVYAEIRCSPANYADAASGRSAWDVLVDLRNAFQRCMERSVEAGVPPAATISRCHVNLIIIATRRSGGDRSDISRHISLAITAADHWRDRSQCHVVGVDLAGFENPDTRGALFQTDFEPVHRVGLAVTVHAGENDDAEAIWQAVFKLNARRLGHALHLSQSPDLLRAVADREIAVEMCPFANAQIKGFDFEVEAGVPPASARQRTRAGGTPASTYPLLDYLRAGVRVTANTDNIGISAASLTDNLTLLAGLCPGITRLDVLQLQRNALDAAFLSPTERARLLAATGSTLPRP